VSTPAKYLKMIDNKMLIWRKKYRKLPQCLNNTIISDKREEFHNKINVNLNIIKNIKNANLNNSKIVDARTLSSPWFCPALTRSQASSILSSSSVGSFLVRRSISQGSSYALSVRVPGVQVQHHLLLVGDGQGVSLHGSEKVFPSIHAMVTHLSIMKESLPCTLDMDNHDSDASEDSDHDDIIDIDSEPELEEIVSILQKHMIWE
jgi:hypothetical protein